MCSWWELSYKPEARLKGLLGFKVIAICYILEYKQEVDVAVEVMIRVLEIGLLLAQSMWLLSMLFISQGDMGVSTLVVIRIIYFMIDTTFEDEA